MESRLNIRELKKIEADEAELYSRLHEVASKSLDYEKGVFEYYLNDEREEIQSICLRSLLFYLNKRDLKYVEFALMKATDESADLDLRNTAIMGIGKVYHNLRNPKIEKTLLNLFDEGQDGVKAEAFMALMSILGLSSVEVMKRNERMIIEYVDINLSLFQLELNELKVNKG